MKSRSALAAAAAAILCLCACPQGNSVTAGKEPILGDTTQVLAYRVSGDSLHTPAYDRIVHYCEGGSFRTGTYPQDAYASEFSVTGNALRIYHDPIPQTSGARVQVFRNYARIGSGKGLEGLWKYGWHGYRVLSGAMSKYESNLFAEGVRIFASDNPAHAGYRFYDQAIACPNESDAPWFVECLTANTKPLP